MFKSYFVKFQTDNMGFGAFLVTALTAGRAWDKAVKHVESECTDVDSWIVKFERVD